MKRILVYTLALFLLELTSCNLSKTVNLQGTNFQLMEMSDFGDMSLYYKVKGGGAGVIDNPVKEVFWNNNYIVVYAQQLETKDNIFFLIHQLPTDTVNRDGVPWTSYNRVPWMVECFNDFQSLDNRMQECTIKINDYHHYRCY